MPFSSDPLIAEAKQRARRRRWLGLLVMLVVAAAAAATLELRSASGSGVPAAGGWPVTHIVIQDLPSRVYFDLRTGRETVKTTREEMWFQRGRHGWHRIVSTEGGRVVGDQVWRAQYTRPHTQAAAVDSFYAALALDYRAALKTGRVQLVDRGTFDGHHVAWVRVLPRRDLHWFVPRELGEVGIDAHSYKPILLRGGTGMHVFYRRVLRARRIAYDAADFKPRGPKSPTAVPGRRQIPPGFALGSTNPSASHGIAVRAPWLTAGTKVAGLKLRAVEPFTIRRSKHHFSYGARNPKPIHGLELVYGPASHGSIPRLSTKVNLYGPQWNPTERATTVYEVPRASRVPPWSTVPDHSIEVQTSLTTVGDHVVRTMSIGYLKQRGLFITIRTPDSQRTALQIARSLRTAAK